MCATACVLLIMTTMRPAYAILGSRITVHNDSPWLLRIMQSWESKSNHNIENAHYLPPGGSVTMQGYNEGLYVRINRFEYRSHIYVPNVYPQRRGQSRDVSFAVERFCPGVKDSRSTLGDQYMGTAYFEVQNPWAGALPANHTLHAVTVYVTRREAICQRLPSVRRVPNQPSRPGVLGAKGGFIFCWADQRSLDDHFFE